LTFTKQIETLVFKLFWYIKGTEAIQNKQNSKNM
jgi:hypothetical protein